MVGKFNLAESWVEFLTIVVLIAGFLLALNAKSAATSYFLIFIIGTILGRVFYKNKKNFKFRWILISIGFLIGFILGDFYGKDSIVVLLFILGGAISYYLHETNFEVLGLESLKRKVRKKK